MLEHLINSEIVILSWKSQLPCLCLVHLADHWSNWNLGRTRLDPGQSIIWWVPWRRVWVRGQEVGVKLTGHEPRDGVHPRQGHRRPAQCLTTVVWEAWAQLEQWGGKFTSNAGRSPATQRFASVDFTMQNLRIMEAFQKIFQLVHLLCCSSLHYFFVFFFFTNQLLFLTLVLHGFQFSHLYNICGITFLLCLLQHRQVGPVQVFCKPGSSSLWSSPCRGRQQPGPVLHRSSERLLAKHWLRGRRAEHRRILWWNMVSCRVVDMKTFALQAAQR